MAEPLDGNHIISSPQAIRYDPVTKDIVCQMQTLRPGAGIELGGGMAIGFMAIPLADRYASFSARLDAALASLPPKE